MNKKTIFYSNTISKMSTISTFHMRSLVLSLLVLGGQMLASSMAGMYSFTSKAIQKDGDYLFFLTSLIIGAILILFSLILIFADFLIDQPYLKIALIVMFLFVSVYAGMNTYYTQTVINKNNSVSPSTKTTAIEFGYVMSWISYVIAFLLGLYGFMAQA